MKTSELGQTGSDEPRLDPPRRALERGAGVLGVALALLGPGRAAAAPSNLPPEVGYNYGEIETPRLAALGGGLRATSTGTSALFVNPANMAAARLYHLTAMAQIHPEAARQSYGGAIVDSIISSSSIAGGLGGTWSQQDPEGIQREWTDLRFGLAMPVGDIFFLGAAGRMLSLSQNGLGPLGQSAVSGGLPFRNIANTITFDAGATLRPVPEFSISITGHNLTNPDTALAPVMGGLGVGFTTDVVSLSADAVLESRTFDRSNVRAMGGVEVLLAERFALRGGYRFDSYIETHALSGGFGYVDPRFAVDASLRRSVAGEEYTVIVFGFTVHVEALGLGSESTSDY